jgi:hypothetical protein
MGEASYPNTTSNVGRARNTLFIREADVLITIKMLLHHRATASEEKPIELATQQWGI